MKSITVGAAVGVASAKAFGAAAMQGIQPSQLQRPLQQAPSIRPGDAGHIYKLRSARWTPERAFQYIEPYAEIKGCNYVNYKGLWHDFDVALIEKELGWARDIVGLNSIRIWVTCNNYQVDREKFFSQFDQLLQIAASKGISVMPVTDALSLRDPDYDPNASGAQKEEVLRFIPSVHGGGWYPPAQISWFAKWDRTKPIIKDFVQGLLSRYADDRRIILWDLCNEASIEGRPLVEWMFAWARQINPSQPLSVCYQGHDLSDVITFHTYTRPGYSSPNSPMDEDFQNELNWAAAWQRPMLCTECLARPFENTPQTFLPFFSRYHIGWYVWGLAAGGPAQFQYPWDWPMASPMPERWFHYLLYPDGKPYNAEEILMIRDFRYLPPINMDRSQSYWRLADGRIVDQPTPPA